MVAPMLLAIGLGPAEVLIVLVIVVLLFGPSKLPALGSGIGKMLQGFKKEMKAIDQDEAEGSAASGSAASGDEIDVTPKG